MDIILERTESKYDDEHLSDYYSGKWEGLLDELYNSFPGLFTKKSMRNIQHRKKEQAEKSKILLETILDAHKKKKNIDTKAFIKKVEKIPYLKAVILHMAYVHSGSRKKFKDLLPAFISLGFPKIKEILEQVIKNLKK